MEVKKSLDALTASSTLRVIEIDPQTDPRWEAFVTNIPVTQSAIYHPAWLQVLEEAYGYKPTHLACEDNNGLLVGILPLFYQHGRRSGHALRSVFTGPLTSDEKTCAALMQAAVERTRAMPGAHLHLKIIHNAIDNQVEDMVGEPAYEVYLLALPEQEELLHLDAPIKRAIKKAAKMGVEVRQAQSEGELRSWYELYLQTTRKFSSLPYPYHYYKTAWRRLHSRGMLRLLLAERVEVGQKKLLGGILLLLTNNTISFISAGWREEEQAVRPNDVLHWQAIKDGCTEGFRWYDFGNVELDNPGLARYKSKWGSEAKLVYDYSYPVPNAEKMSTTDSSSSKYTQRLMQTAWEHLPNKAIWLLSDWYYALRLY